MGASCVLSYEMRLSYGIMKRTTRRAALAPGILQVYSVSAFALNPSSNVSQYTQ